MMLKLVCRQGGFHISLKADLIGQSPVRRGGGRPCFAEASRRRSKLCRCGYGDWLVESDVYLLTSQFFTMSKIIIRMQSSTPKFFKTLRNIGVALAAVSAAVFESPVELATIITDMAGYLVVAGSVMGAVSQSAVLYEEE
jgi:hypothetical protein